jgi:hypothetical protein
MPEAVCSAYTKERGRLGNPAGIVCRGGSFTPRQRWRSDMRVSGLVFAGILAFGASAVSANATPAAPDLGVMSGSPNIVEAAWGCGRGFHPNHWGRCVPNRWGYYRPWRDRYYGGGYDWRWRHRYYYGY